MLDKRGISALHFFIGVILAIALVPQTASAAMTLKLTDTVVDKAPSKDWTVADGHITQKAASGSYSADYTWNPPPATIDAKGFTLSLQVMDQVSAKAPNNTSINAGIGASSSDFIFDKDNTTVSALAGNVGQSKSSSLTLNVKPPAGLADGSKVAISVGAAYGPGVTYTYTVGNGGGQANNPPGQANGQLAASIDDCVPGTMITISALPSLNCHITISSWRHDTSDPVEVVLPRAVDTFGDHANGIQVMGEGEEDPHNWTAPYSWGLFVFACPAQQGTGANCNGSITAPGPVSVPIIVRQGDASVNLTLMLTAIPHAGSPGNPPVVTNIPIPPLGHSGPGTLDASLDCPPEIIISALPSLNCHIIITGWAHTADPVRVILPRAVDTFGNHSNGIQVLGQGEEDVFNWTEPSYSWGLFVFACPSQQGTGANCYDSVTNPGLNSVPIIVQQGNDEVGVVLSLFARPRPGGTNIPPIAQLPPVIKNVSQPQLLNNRGQIVREAAIIHVVNCAARDQIYIYDYQNRSAFRAIRPPDYGHPLGGKDFATFLDAVRAACGVN